MAFLSKKLKKLKFVVWCRYIYRKISQNIKKIWNFLYFEKSNKSIFFVPKIVHMTISIKIGSNSSLNYRILPVFLNSLLIQFIWNLRFRNFVENFKSLSKFRFKNWVPSSKFSSHFSDHTLLGTFYWSHFTDHILLISFHWSHFTEHMFYIRPLSISVCLFCSLGMQTK